ncbi:hypothetical protein SGUI_1141 [Serinicoccus hydrothermalis]|uniref:Uncharacterized protein n=1 Tax=Serinicoccus hydrothermalis TaxID=1758689 RepID=A0A1B1NAT0_9MICO|nr:hypothetical protein [Serinicoccus hydrothermalis]ANS78537.1 hypothetical protein SGUI_1141 [Serinicoccus hydrothermalis]
MSGGATLVFPDGEGLADLATYARRAALLDEEGAIRLQVGGGAAAVLAAWVCVLPGQGVLRSGLVLGLRTMRLEPGQEALDTTVPLSGLADRFARRASTGDVSTVLPVPPTTVAPPWAAQSPPMGGWEQVDEVAPEVLQEAARAGIAEVAEGAPEGSGAAAVGALRARVWGRDLPGHRPAVPAGAALAAHALGFLGPQGAGIPAGRPATVHRSGPWLRVSTAAGHVVLRP